MTFSVSSSELLKRLQIAGGAISNNVVIPILEDFLFTLEGNILTITASDLETTIKTELEVMPETGGAVAVPARILIDTLKALPSQPVTFRSDETNNAVTLTSSYGTYKLAGENGDDFPKVPQPEDVDTFSMPASGLIQGIGKTIFATSNDELRPAMSGVLFQIDFGSMKMVATDAHKLVKYSYTGIQSNVNTQFIIPKKVLIQLKASLPSNADVKVSFNKSNVFFSSEGVNMICRLIDAKYPDYNAVIPTDNPNKLTVNRVDLHNSLKRIANYANKTTNQVVLEIEDGTLSIMAQDMDFSNEAKEKLTCTYEGEEMKISFNAKFLAEMLGVLESEEVLLNMSFPNRAGILLPAENEDGVNILMLVMPVMLSVGA